VETLMFEIVQPQQAEPAMVAVRATSWMEPRELAGRLASAIAERGGWILSSTRGERELNLLFEFECDSSLDIYVALVSCGLSMSKQGHLDLTRMWQCARNGSDGSCPHIARIALTAFASGAEQVQVSCAR
jgi:hypothetical protein